MSQQHEATDNTTPGGSELAQGLASLRSDVGLPPAEEHRMEAPTVNINLPIQKICGRVAELLKASDGRWGLYRRDKDIGFIDAQGKWETMTPRLLRTWLTDVRGILPVAKWTKGEPDADGKPKHIPLEGEFTQDQAATILESGVLRAKLPEIKHIHRVRMPVLRDELDERPGPCGTPTSRRRGFRRLALLPEGYDAQSKTYTLGGYDFDEAMEFDEAQKWLMSLLRYYPWGDCAFGSMNGSRSKAIIITGMLTVFGARLFSDRPPMFALTANEPGSGKGVLSRWMLQPVWGEPASSGWNHYDKKETKQALDAVAQNFGEYLFYDNVPKLSKGCIENSDLERWITQGRWGCRVLGTKGWFEGQLYAVTIMNGNGLRFNDDLERRTMLVDLFAPERSVDRERPRDQVDMDDDWFANVENMNKTLACLWSLIRYWDEFDRPGVMTSDGKKQRPLASFTGWSKGPPAIASAAGFGNALEKLEAPDVGNEEAGMFERLKRAILLEHGAGDRFTLKLSEIVAIARREELFVEKLWTVADVLESERSKGGFVYHEPKDKAMVVESVEKRAQAERWMSFSMRSWWGKKFKERVASGNHWRTLNGEVWVVGSRDAKITNGESEVVFTRQAAQA